MSCPGGELVVKTGSWTWLLLESTGALEIKTAPPYTEVGIPHERSYLNKTFTLSKWCGSA